METRQKRQETLFKALNFYPQKVATPLFLQAQPQKFAPFHHHSINYSCTNFGGWSNTDVTPFCLHQDVKYDVTADQLASALRQSH